MNHYRVWIEQDGAAWRVPAKASDVFQACRRARRLARAQDGRNRPLRSYAAIYLERVKRA